MHLKIYFSLPWIHPKINQIIIDTLKHYGPKEIGVFGSYARGEMRPESDIDIMIDIDENVSLFDLGGMYMDLAERLNRKIDLVTKGGMNPIFKPYIKKDLIQIYHEPKI